MNNDTNDIKNRILALCPPDQAPILDFELRMLVATLEADALKFIHQQWRPIADERDQLKGKLAEALAKPPRDRSAKPATTDEDGLAARFAALTTEHGNLTRQHTQLREKNADLRERHDQLNADFQELVAEHTALLDKHKKLQQDCDELLEDKRPARVSA